MLDMSSQAIFKILFLSMVKFLIFDVASRAELDRWAYLNNGGSVVKLAMNENVLYAVTFNSTLIVLQRNGVFSQIDTAVADVDVNSDSSVWAIKNSSLFFQNGVSSRNLIGNNWTQVVANAKLVTSSRYGLLLIVDANAMVYSRAGITTSTRSGSSWVFANGYNVVKLSCGNRFCVIVNAISDLSSTGPIENKNSPSISHWTPIDSNVKDASAYGDNSLWKIDSNSALWKAVHFHPNSFHVLWKRSSFTETFREIAVTDRIQLAVENDGFIKVLTGCPIFDFEENDIRLWTAEGNAFEKQPVVGQEVAYGRRSGKVGDRFIDTYSSSMSYELDEGSTNASQGDNRTGTLRSPLFQIRTDLLHFVVGGGSYPINYVGLYVQDIEVKRNSGESVDRVGPKGAVRSSRHWWDVTTYKNTCAYVKIVDQGRETFDHTIFDDLRASPPCFKQMKVVLENLGHNGIRSVGQFVEYKLHLHGFYTSDTRQLIVTISYPVIGDSPHIFIENIVQHWVKCPSHFSWKRKSQSFPSSRRHWHTLSLTIGDYLLSDITLKIIMRVYDHQQLPIARVKSIDWTARVNFAGEYVHKRVQQVKVQKFGNETAKLVVYEGIVLRNEYFVGGSIEYKVDLRHHHSLSLQRARHMIIRVFLPPHITLTNVKGLVAENGDQRFSPSPSQHVVLIPELLLLDRKIIIFVMRIDGHPNWRRKNLQKIKGQIIVDELSYCKRKGCKNALGSEIEISTVFRNKAYNFEFSYRKGDTTASQNKIYSKISSSNGSIVIICGPYMHNGAGRCYYGSLTIWYKLNPILHDVAYYNILKREILGFTFLKKKIKLFGDNFDSVHFLSDDQWKVAIQHSQDILTRTNVYNSSALSKEVHERGTLWNMWECCK